MADVLFEGDPSADPASEMRKRAREKRAADRVRKSNIIFEGEPEEDQEALLPGRAGLGKLVGASPGGGKKSSRPSFEEQNAEWTRRHNLRQQAKNAGQEQGDDTGRSDIFYHSQNRNRPSGSIFGGIHASWTIIAGVIIGLVGDGRRTL